MDVEAAARAIKRGEIVGVPTDTVYGIAADLYDEAALDRLSALKGPESRSRSWWHPLSRVFCSAQCPIAPLNSRIVTGPER